MANGFTLLRVHKSQKVSDSWAVYTPFRVMGLHFTSVPRLRLACSFEFSLARGRAERSGFEKDTATRRCCLLHLRTATMLTRLRLVTNTNATDHSLTSRKRCTPGLYLVLQQQRRRNESERFFQADEGLYDLFEIGLRSLLLPF